jgi:hypothetical protein
LLTFVDRGAPFRQNWARQNPPFLSLKRRRACAAVRFFVPNDEKFLRVDLDALGECAKVIASRSRHANVAGALLVRQPMAQPGLHLLLGRPHGSVVADGDRPVEAEQNIIRAFSRISDRPDKA